MAQAGNNTGAGGPKNVARATRKRRREPPAPAPPLGQIPKLDAFPGATQAKQAGARAQRAKPAPVLPQIPVIRNPTPKQTVAAQHAITQTVRLHAKRTGQSAAEATADLKADPRAQRFLKTAAHYAKAGERQTAAMVGRALGARGSSEQVRLGRLAIARQQQRDQVHPGRLDRKVSVAGLASVNASALSRAVIGATSLNTGDIGPRTAFRKVAGDVGTLATGPFIGAYEVGAGAVDVARGRGTGRLERLGAGIAKGLAEEVRHPLKYAGEHPLLAALDVAGAASVVGHVAGAGARVAGSQAERAGGRGALARAGSTVRPPIALSGDAAAPTMARTYSKDLGRKAVQVAQDRARKPLLDKNGRPVTVMDRGRRLPVLQARPHERDRILRREADFVAARANAVERKVRQDASHEFKVRGIRGRNAKDLVSMVVEGTITSARHFESDLRQHRARIAGSLQSGEYRHSGERASAEHRLAVIDAALGNPRVLAQRDRIVAAGEDIGRKLNAGEAEAVRLGILHPKRAARSRLVVPAVEHVQARHFSPEEIKALGEEGPAAVHGALRHSDGTFLSNAEIEGTLRAKGRDPGTVAYLPHRFDVRGQRAFHTQFRPGSRPTIDKPGVRTGSAYAKGATEASPELIREQGTRLATQVAKGQQLDRLVSDYGLKHPTGRYYSAKEALEKAQRIEADTGERLVPVRAFGVKAGKQAEAKARNAQDVASMETLHQKMLNQRIVTKPGNAQNVVLVPAPLIKQLERHLRPAGEAEKFAQALNPAFRLAVLPQPRWLTGNFVEPFFVRLTASGSGLNVFGLATDIRAATKALHALERSGDPKLQAAAKELRAQQVGSGLFIGGRGATVRRSLEELGPLKYGAVVRDLPVVKQMVDTLAMLPKSFFAANRAIESVAQRAAFGKDLRRDIQQFTGSWAKTVVLGSKAVREAAEGLTNTPTQRRFMRSQHVLLGKYEGWSPGMRRLVQSVMPFVPWSLNAARFTFWTMPAHHSALTALLVQTDKVVQADWDRIHKDVPPGGLKFAIPNGKGGWIDLARYTPTGAFTEAAGGGTWRSLSDQILLQINGAQAALAGQDPFGRDLQVPKDAAHPQGRPTAGQLLGIAANQLAGSLIPGYSTTQRLREGGGTGFATSTPFSPKTKPGSKNMGALRRTFDPLRPTYLKSPTSAPSVSGGPTSRQDQLLERAAEREAAGGLSERQMQLLERAATR